MEHFGSHDEETTQAAAQSALVVAHPFLELHLLRIDGSERWLAFQAAQIDLTSHGLPWVAEVQSNYVRFWRSGQAQEVHPGECLEWEGHRAWVVDSRSQDLAVLETLQLPEGKNQSWTLRAQAYRLGRKGTERINQLEINHPTVSREQATLFPTQGRFELMAESSKSPTLINGRFLTKGERTLLEHGDLLQLGEVPLRFRQVGRTQAGRLNLKVRCLGHFAVEWGTLSLNEANWRGQKASWLLARLAWSWGQPVRAEYLMELFWPELPPLRGRKNLSQCISDLKSNLQIQDERQLLLRNSISLQLLPELPFDHDAGTVRDKVTSSDPRDWEMASALYTGPYLPTCFEPWAEAIRQRLHQGVVYCLERLARYQLAQGGWEESLRSALQGLELEPCSQALAQVGMEASLEGQRPELALDCYSQVTRKLHEEHLEPSLKLQQLAGLAESRRNHFA